MVVQSFKLNPILGTPSERVRKIRDRMLSMPRELDIERARCYTRIYKQMENAPPCMKNVKALEEFLKCLPIRIEEDELLVGVKSSKVRADPLEIERGMRAGIFGFIYNDSIDQKIRDAFARNFSLFNRYAPLPEEEINELKNEILPYWKDKTVSARQKEYFKEAGLSEEKKTMNASIPFSGSVSSTDMFAGAHGQGHVVPGYRRVLKMGFKGIEKMAQEGLVNLKETDEHYDQCKDFYESVVVAAQAVCEYSNRYADLAMEIAQNASETRRAELLEIAERVRRVPAHPPRTFMEALQSIWMTNVVMEMSYGEGNIFSQGRVDQYLYPYYVTDLAEGRITYEEALEALEEYLVKLASVVIAGQNNITIGGLDNDGNDATNDISYMFLEAIANVKSLLNTLSIRISSKTPREFIKRTIEAIKFTGGMGIHNDGVLVPQLHNTGYSLEDARDYSLVGCVEPAGTGNDFSYTAGNVVQISILLNMALNEGRTLFSGTKTMGAKTPPASTFKSFEDVKNAWVEQVKFAIDLTVKKAELKDKAFADYLPSPLLSSSIEGCLENGMDATRNGARYNNNPMGSQGLATVTNSLAAIRWAVFEEKLVTMEDLVNHMNKNFKGAEQLREKLRNKAPKYGNGDEKTDELAKWVANSLCEHTRKYKARGGDGIYHNCLVSSGTQIMEGKMLGATADGRLMGEPVANGISPANGTEKNGLTMALRSIAYATAEPLLTNGASMNVRVNPTILETDEGIEHFTSIVEAYLEMGGRELQVNPISSETLKDAQTHPEKYPDLSVKVSGYSARFVDLTKELQNDIIDRTVFNEL
ncbi:MAG: pyruvate formate lyase family protein [Candidatus Odinarchaeota archaeon]